jgi:hypothetical protein
MIFRPSRLVLLAWLVGAAAVLSPPASATTQQQIVPFEGFFVNSCAGDESIAFDGYLHFVLRVDTDATGAFHIISTANGQHLSGVGVTSGKRYSIPAAGHSSVYIPQGSFVATDTQTFKLVSQGNLDNFSLRITMHFTVVDGVVKSEVIRTETDCQG